MSRGGRDVSVAPALGNCQLNWLNVVIMTTAERVGQGLNQDAWDQVRRLIENLDRVVRPNEHGLNLTPGHVVLKVVQ